MSTLALDLDNIGEFYDGANPVADPDDDRPRCPDCSALLFRSGNHLECHNAETSENLDWFEVIDGVLTKIAPQF